jgi:hypothetical protein
LETTNKNESQKRVQRNIFVLLFGSGSGSEFESPHGDSWCGKLRRPMGKIDVPNFPTFHTLASFVFVVFEGIWCLGIVI